MYDSGGLDQVCANVEDELDNLASDDEPGFNN